jgi:hypothetical protein
MDGWIRWAAPAAAVAITMPAYAYQYSSVGAAQQQAFPGARFEEVQPQRVWKVLNGAGSRAIFLSTTSLVSISTSIIRLLSMRTAPCGASKSLPM